MSEANLRSVSDVPVATPQTSRVRLFVGALGDTAGELYDSVSKLDLGITPQHRSTLGRLGLLVGVLAALVAVTLAVSVLSAETDLERRTSAREVRRLVKERDRIELDLHARRAPLQLDVAVRELGLVPAQAFEVLPNGEVIPTRVAPRPHSIEPQAEPATPGRDGAAVVDDPRRTP